ncbi:MAG: hypothetical protein AAYR33_04445 [Acetobacteraceae bacterium]
MKAPRWAEIPAKLFFSTHLMSEIIAAYYAHPVAWSEIGYGARQVRAAMSECMPMSVTRGKLFQRKMVKSAKSERSIKMSADPMATPRGINGEAPDVFHRGRWIPM